MRHIKVLLVMNYYELLIKQAKNKETIKEIVRDMFKDTRLEDIDFNHIIYNNVIPKLEELGIVFDRENEIDYEIVMKEEY